MIVPDNLKELPGNEVLDMVDSTKLKCFMTCPRKYLYEYILHWRKDRPNIHLEFGTAWHLAKEHLLNHGTTKAEADKAYILFLAHFRKFFPESDDLNLAPKSPGNAYVALYEYVEQYAQRNDSLKILATEISGKVPLGDHLLSVKIDAIVEDPDGYLWDLDHKTAGRDSPTDDQAWSLSTQINAYVHALYCMYPHDKVHGALIDVTVLRKTGNLHKRLHIYRKFEALEEWYEHTLVWLEQLQDEYGALSMQTTDDSLSAFPKNTESCTRYGLCPYFSLCQVPHNPMLSTAPPQGYKREIWSPHFSDKSWQPKHILEPDGTLHKPSPEDLSGHKAALEAYEENRKTNELDDFNFKGFI